MSTNNFDSEFGLKDLVEAGAIINAVDNEGKTPLHLAIYYSNASLAIKYLIDHGADVIAADHEEKQPFHLAALHPAATEIFGYLI